MKKVLSLSLVIITVFCLCSTLASCSKENSIVGSWEFGENGFSYTFEKDGSGYFKLGLQENKFTYTIHSNELTILYDANTITYKYTFEIQNNDTLVLTDEKGKTTTYTRK